MSGHSTSRGYGPSRWSRLYFDGDERKFEQWLVKFMGYMRLQKLHDIIDPPTNTTGDDTTATNTGEGATATTAAVVTDNTEKNAECFAELIQFLDNRSLSLVMRDAYDDGKKALSILKDHYAGKGKPRVISLYTELTSLCKMPSESVTDYIIKAENTATALRNADEAVSDALLIAMVLKGLPSQYKPFEVVMTQSDKNITFSEFKVALRNYEDTENARGTRKNDSSVMKINSGNQKQKPVVCYSCGQPGHKSNVCKNKGINNKKWCSYCKLDNHTNKTCRNKGKAAEQVKQCNDGELHHFSFTLNTCGPHEISNDLFLVDTGATTHIVNCDSNFISFDKNFDPETHFIELADGSKTNNVALKRGTVEIFLRNTSGNVVLGTLDDVLYVPSYPHNIFSVQAATVKGACINFFPESAQLVTGNGTKFEIEKFGKLFYLRNNSLSTSSLCTVRSLNVESWHRLLGHCNRSDILKMEKIVQGMHISGKNDFNCEVCVLGKQTQVISRKPDERAKRSLEFIHTDLNGPIDPVSSDGFKFVISFSDDYSGFVFTYFLKHKNDASRALEKFLADSAPFGQIKRMRTDGGGEYVSKDFKSILTKHCIKHELSAPYSPHQNGTAERWWRTCFDMGRCFLIESKLPKHLWPYAVMMATFVRNRCYQQRTKQIPFSLLTGKLPDFNNLYRFGSTCYAYDKSAKKLDPRSIKGVFIGYDRESPSYLVYFPDENKIKKFRCIKCFDEMNVKDDGHDVPLVYEEDVDDFRISKRRIPEPPVPQLDSDVPAPVVVSDDHDIGNVDGNVPTPVVVSDSQDVGSVEDEHVQLMGGTEDRRREYPARERRRPQHLHDYDLSNDQIDIVTHEMYANIDYCFKASTIHIPKTYKEALASPESHQWKLAMDDEMNALTDNNTFSLMELPKDKKLIGGRWVYALKSDPDGNDVCKARYVAKGYTQVYGSDYFDTFSPTAKMTSVRIFMQYSVEYGLVIHQLDVKTAYLNAAIDCEIYMKQPEGYIQPGNENLVCKLNKSLYGLKQSGRNWNVLLHKSLIDIDFVQCSGDACVYVHLTNSILMGIILIWVDDIIISVKSMKLMDKIKDHLKGKFKMKDMGKINYFLGIHFVQSDSKLEMNQSHYLQRILEKYGMADCKPRSTPCELRPSIPQKSDICDNPRTYREIIGSLIYAMTCTRPDLSWVVSKLSQHLADPDESDWIMVKHVLRYIKGTLEYKLCYTKTADGLALTGYSDSDWASSLDRRSTSGYYFSLNPKGPPISWKTRKQQTVALSSCEAEYMALSLSTQEILYLMTILKDLLIHVNPIIYSDSQSALSLIRNPVNHNRSKHIDIRYHFIREKFTNGSVDFRYVPTDKNVSDLMTKPATKQKLNFFQQYIFGE